MDDGVGKPGRSATGARAIWAAAGLLALLAVPGTASGHAEQMSQDELIETIMDARGVPAGLERLLVAEAEADAEEPPGVEAGAAALWYSRDRAAARIGSSDADRFTLAGGCFRLQPADGGFLARAGEAYASRAGLDQAEAFRFQATGLGSYLLLGSGGRFLTVQRDALTATEVLSRRSEWVVKGDEHSGFEFTSRGFSERFTLSAAAECAVFPEIQINATGRPYAARPRFGEASGTIDLHSHFMAFEGFGRGLHCGRPWHPLGVASALVDCPDHAPNGLGGLASNMLVFQDPSHMHDPDGWPTFQGWPTHEWVFTHEQTYYRWIERYWRGGLRLLTLLAVDNSAACFVNVHRTESCNEMDAVRRQLRAAKELQAYIDAQAGGPGQGFFRIVRNPFQARRVINSGKLAVVLGIEVSEPLDCGLRNGVPQCGEADVDARLAEMFRAGVRQMEIVNKFDNAFTGVAMDGGFQGPFLNAANKLVTGEFWDVETCTGRDEDRTQVTSVPPAAATLISLLPGGSLQLPAYPPAPHCNTKGLSQLGRYLIRAMARRSMIFDPDHMSVLARRQALDLVAGLDYSGIVSSHSWGDRTSYRRIMQLGGVVTPMAPHADEFDDEWRRQRELYAKGNGSRRYGFGFGFADDMNGFGGPRDPTEGTDAEIEYPFDSPIDPGVTFERQKSGTRTYDLNTDGVAHFGQWPDWTEGVRRDAGRRVIRDLRNGAEAYLRMWERAVGIRGPRRMKSHGHFKPGGLRRMRLGMRPNQLLRRVGQPVTRTRGWSWRVRRSRGARLGAAFVGGRKVGLVATTSSGYLAGGIGGGKGIGRLRTVAEHLGGGIWVNDTRGGSRFIYGLRHGRVAFVGVGTAKATASAGRIARSARIALRPR